MIGTHRNMPAKPQSPPQTASDDQDRQRTEVQRAAHQPRIEHAADGELDHAQPEHGGEERPEAAELDQHQQGREQHADQRADERDVVHHEHDQRPEARVLAADRSEHEPGQERREHAHQRLDPQIALHALLDVAQDRPDGGSPARGREQRVDLAVEARLLEQHEGDIQPDHADAAGERGERGGHAADQDIEIDLADHLAEALRWRQAERGRQPRQQHLEIGLVGRRGSGHGADIAHDQVDHQPYRQRHHGDAQHQLLPVPRRAAPDADPVQALGGGVDQLPDQHRHGERDQDVPPGHEQRCP